MAIIGTRDPLEEALKSKRAHSFYNVPTDCSNLFKMRKYDFENFGLSFSQRVCAFCLSLFIGIILLFYSFTRLFTTLYNPAAFALPYAVSNLIFFFMFGFLSGFKSYLRNLFSRSKRPFTALFIISTFMTLYSTIFLKSYFVHLFLVVVQVLSFACFTFTFLPGGATGMANLISLLFRK